MVWDMICNIMKEKNATRQILNIIRDIKECTTTERDIITEEKVQSNESIAITDEPKFGQNVLTSQIQQFRSSVESGAQFSKVNPDDVSSCPLIYMPRTGNLVFSGVIPCLNNLKWQFVLKTSTGNGCFLWADGLILNKDNMQILNKLYGFYCNWKEQWNAESADLERMVQNMQNK